VPCKLWKLALKLGIVTVLKLMCRLWLRKPAAHSDALCLLFVKITNNKVDYTIPILKVSFFTEIHNSNFESLILYWNKYSDLPKDGSHQKLSSWVMGYDICF
jgi:hypothetical protein